MSHFIRHDNALRTKQFIGFLATLETSSSAVEVSSVAKKVRAASRRRVRGFCV